MFALKSILEWTTVEKNVKVSVSSSVISIFIHNMNISLRQQNTYKVYQKDLLILVYIVMKYGKSKILFTDYLRFMNVHKIPNA